MVSPHPPKFGGHGYCGSGDMIFLLVEVQDSTCPRSDPPSLKHIASHVHTNEISGRRQNNLPVCRMKDSRSWSLMSKRATDET